jgi:hypothetical protein
MFVVYVAFFFGIAMKMVVLMKQGIENRDECR